MQQPVLYLGLIGFEPDEEVRLQRRIAANVQLSGGQLQQPNDSPLLWQVVDFRDADALLVCGRGVQHGYSTSVEFKSSVRKPGAPLGLQLDEIKLPFGLSHVHELRAMGVDVGQCPEFDPSLDSSLLKTIQYFETSLRPLRSLYALAVELTERRKELDGEHTYHLERNGALDAIVDAPGRRVLMQPSVRPVDITSGVWLRRPRSANFAPAHFLECSLEEMTWLFALHSQHLDLPERYTQKTIHLRRNPRVRGSLLLARHAALLDRLSLVPPTLTQLRQDLPSQEQWLERDLFALYLTRAISTEARAADEAVGSSLPSSALDTTGRWMLDRLSRRASTIFGDLKSRF
jgi:hypothetical protein